MQWRENHPNTIEIQWNNMTDKQVLHWLSKQYLCFALKHLDPEKLLLNLICEWRPSDWRAERPPSWLSVMHLFHIVAER